MPGPDARITVAGAGSIGCFIGGALARAGRKVTLLARPRMVEELQSCGLHLTDLSGFDERIPAARLSVTADPAALKAASLVLVTVKSAATKGMAGEIAAQRTPGAVVLSLQNGVDNLPALRSLLGETNVLGGVVGFNVVHMGEGRFHRGTSGQVVIEAGRAELRALLAVPGLDLAVTADIAGVQWGKLLLNLNNALNALSGLPLREQLQDRAWRRLMAAQIEEALAVYAAAGIVPVPGTPIAARFLPRILRLPTAIFRAVAAPMLQIDPEARSSMWEDLVRRRPTEIDFLQGAILRLARRHGVAAPLCERVAALVKRAEAAAAGPPGLTPDAVSAP
ncbi:MULTISPECIES: 2-dehydropantoate 2-reductase [Rhodomicrobium]|uniref:2-dehydropantoate 2-reductase n=1 Tax=Rhodomicrobium TaxID=1068 RepID=UPI000B4AA511|nr:MULTISPECIES: 2-dehydropantoate 2-reductase [Rhodomicrobium]